MPPGAARNALDCALWDLEAKRAAARRMSLPACRPALPTTALRSRSAPAAMAAAAAKAAAAPCSR